MNVIDTIQRMHKPLHVRIRNMLTRGVVESDLGPTGNFVGGSIARLKVYGLAGKLKEPVEYFQPVGYLCVAPGGAEVIAGHLQGDSSMPVALAVDDRRYRPRKGPGATADFGPLEPVLYGPEGAVAFHGLANGEAFLGNADESPAGAPDNLAALAKLVKAELDAIRSDMETELNEIRAAHDSHVHITTATVGVGPAVGVLSPTAAPLSTTTIDAAGDVACERTHIG